MAGNRGTTSLRNRNRAGNPMREFDRLPADLRQWTAQAMLPWRAATVKSAYNKALARTGCQAKAIAELDRLQRSLVSKDARRVWGKDHPAAS